MKKFRWIIAGFLVTVLSGCASYASDNPDLMKISIQSDLRQIPFWVELALTPEEKSRGLMYREDLNSREGMLFIYDRPHDVSFWMRNVLIPLDMLFFDENRTLVYVAENVEPCPPDAHSCPLTSPDTPVQYVLELKGGIAKKRGITLGDALHTDGVN